MHRFAFPYGPGFGDLQNSSVLPTRPCAAHTCQIAHIEPLRIDKTLDWVNVNVLVSGLTTSLSMRMVTPVLAVAATSCSLVLRAQRLIIQLKRAMRRPRLSGLK